MSKLKKVIINYYLFYLAIFFHNLNKNLNHKINIVKQKNVSYTFQDISLKKVYLLSIIKYVLKFNLIYM